MKAFALGVVLCLGAALAGGYRVQPGDTLWRISVSHDVDLTVLLLLNPEAADGLKAGTELRLPERHRVAKGETLWRIARRYGTDVNTLRRLNDLKGDALAVGQVLWVPPAPPGSAAPQAPASGPAVPVERIESVAKTYLGAPYRWGATGPDAFDCSGYVGRVYAELGVELPRSTRDLWAKLAPVEHPKPGDLVFFSFGGRGVDHVGIYLAGGRFIHANSLKNRVMIEPLNAPWYRKVFLGARRVPSP
ncbi:MAG TPA: LysM peptidoglycan-binding domain-containing protein [Oceanithermus profundus]|uniref:LysM peptidoglycan-binding domain-containing protein n=1 Tax=Oceanithermus profundus TaxID=187137 RepID=A0A7C4Z6N8_9DEIN|nr:LysM peptidoglycan-binding domain-containing protein [Oceanithermus profundus]